MKHFGVLHLSYPRGESLMAHVVRISRYFRDLLEELVLYIREAVDRKQENMRRRRRRDALRLQVVRVFELIAENGTFGMR